MTTGRRLFNADPHRATVRDLVRTGLSQRKIAIQLGINRVTLRKHFREELATRVKAEKSAHWAEIAQLDAWMTPLEYMLSVMRDPAAMPGRRDKMAVAAAPFVHSRVGEIGIKAQRQLDAENADEGSPWADLMQQPPPKRSN